MTLLERCGHFSSFSLFFLSFHVKKIFSSRFECKYAFVGVKAATINENQMGSIEISSTRRTKSRWLFYVCLENRCEKNVSRSRSSFFSRCRLRGYRGDYRDPFPRPKGFYRDRWAPPSPMKLRRPGRGAQDVAAITGEDGTYPGSGAAVAARQPG